MAVTLERVMSEEDGKGSPSALHLKDCSLPANGSQTKSRMAHLVAEQPAAQLPWCLSFLIPAAPNPQLVLSPPEHHQASPTVKGAIPKTRQKPLHLVEQVIGNNLARPEGPSSLWSPPPPHTPPTPPPPGTWGHRVKAKACR